MFNILPKSGFDMNNEAELTTTVGSFYQTDDQLSFGGHTERFAYYASVNGNRSNLGLETPVPQVYHDAENGYGGFSSLMYNLDSERPAAFRRATAPGLLSDSLRSRSHRLRKFAIRYARACAITNVETDGYALFSWVHTFNPNVVLTVSPFYHYNSSGYHSLPTDMPVATTAVFSTNYGGGQAVLSFHAPRNDAQVGIYSFAAGQNENFGLIFNDGSGAAPIQETDNDPRRRHRAFRQR